MIDPTTCHCLHPVPDRRYGGLWYCRVCWGAIGSTRRILRDMLDALLRYTAQQEAA